MSEYNGNTYENLSMERIQEAISILRRPSTVDGRSLVDQLRPLQILYNVSMSKMNDLMGISYNKQPEYEVFEIF